jgi:hypothetical protein
MAIKLTESQLRQIIREELARVEEVYVNPNATQFTDAPPVTPPPARSPAGTHQSSAEALMDTFTTAIDMGEVDPYRVQSILDWLNTQPGYNKFSDYNRVEIAADLQDAYTAGR